MKKIGILGSGATAFAAASRLLEYSENLEVTVIDFGGEFDVERTPSAVGSTIKASASNELFDIPDFFKVFSPSETVLGSAAHGGWAEAWGATIVPLSENEIIQNGLTFEEYKNGETLVRRFLKSGSGSFKNESLRVFPKVLSEKLGAKSKRIESVQMSDLGIRAFDTDINKACNQCGDCLFGCPKNHIFKPSVSWPHLLREGKFRSINRVWIEQVSESGAGVTVYLKDSLHRNLELEFDYVFCGLGAIQTAALLIRSDLAQNVVIKDQQMVVTPFVDPRLRNLGTDENRIGLSELFILGKVPLIGGSLFTQMYGSSKSLTHMILNQTPWLKRAPKKLLDLIFSRIGIAMQFLDSTHSGSIEVSEEVDLVKVIGKKNKISTFFQKILPGGILFSLKLIPLTFLARVYKVGDGYHFGSSFPLGGPREANSSDHLGRPNGMIRFSIVDSSILNALSAKPQTFNSMVISTVVVSRVLNSEIGEQQWT